MGALTTDDSSTAPATVAGIPAATVVGAALTLVAVAVSGLGVRRA